MKVRDEDVWPFLTKGLLFLGWAALEVIKAVYRVKRKAVWLVFEHWFREEFELMSNLHSLLLVLDARDSYPSD